MNKEELQKLIESRINNRDFSSPESWLLPRMYIGGISLSIQASHFHYSTPREDARSFTHVEVGFPSFKFSDKFIGLYAEEKEEPLETVYPYVPIGELVEEIFLEMEKYK